MLPDDILRATASASARVLARAIDDGRAADQVAALLAIVRDSVQMMETTGADQVDAGQTVYGQCRQPAGNVIMLAAHRSGRRDANSGEPGINLA